MMINRHVHHGRFAIITSTFTEISRRVVERMIVGVLSVYDYDKIYICDS